MKNSSLTPEQQAVLFDKATEAPFSGKWLENHEDGTYACANCGAKLFDSQTKYESNCGWPRTIRDLVGKAFGRRRARPCWLFHLRR